MSIDWTPAAIAIGIGLFAVVCVRVVAWLGPRSAALRTQRNIERALNQHHDRAA